MRPANTAVPGVLPEFYRRGLGPRLRRRLEEACGHFNVEQAFIAFIEDDGLFWVSKNLWIGREKLPLLILDIHEGLCGWAARENKVVAYPQDQDAKQHFLHAAPIEPTAVSQMVGPIHYLDKVTGVVLLHSMNPQQYFGESDKKILRERFLQNMDSEIRNAGKTGKTRRSIRRAAERCFDRIPDNARGYIAVKGWDGRLDYFKVGDDQEKLLDLDLWEGLCGRVMATGEPINSPDVLAEPAYQPSDPEIRSEIVYPIKDGDEVTGVINMEHRQFGAYDTEFESFLMGEAAGLSSLIRDFRKPPGDHFGYGLGDLVGSVTGLLEVAAHRDVIDVERRIIDLLQKKAANVLRARKWRWWWDAEKPPLTNRREVQEGILQGGLEEEGDGKYILYATVSLSGTPVGVIAIEKDEPGEDDRRILQVFCRVAAAFLRQWRHENQLRLYIELLQILTKYQNGTGVIEQAVLDLPRLLDAQHCTLFYRAVIAGGVVFVPGPSTSRNVYEVRGAPDADPWYEPREDGGLTAWVAATGLPLRIRNISENSELRDVSPSLEWKGRLSEDRESKARSYLACPIFAPGISGQPTPEDIIGVLRAYRDLKSRRSGFSEKDLLILQTVSRLLEKPLVEVVEAGRLEYPFLQRT